MRYQKSIHKYCVLSLSCFIQKSKNALNLDFLMTSLAWNLIPKGNYLGIFKKIWWNFVEILGCKASFSKRLPREDTYFQVNLLVSVESLEKNQYSVKYIFKIKASSRNPRSLIKKILPVTGYKKFSHGLKTIRFLRLA